MSVVVEYRTAAKHHSLKFTLPIRNPQSVIDFLSFHSLGFQVCLSSCACFAQAYKAS